MQFALVFIVNVVQYIVHTYTCAYTNAQSNASSLCPFLRIKLIRSSDQIPQGESLVVQEYIDKVGQNYSLYFCCK